MDEMDQSMHRGGLLHTTKLKRMNVWHHDSSESIKNKAFKYLAKTAVREIGLRSLSIESGWGTVPTGKTLAHFHREGMWPWLIEELNIEHTGRHNVGVKFFRTQLRISPGPHDLRSLMASSERSIASGLMIYSSGV